MSKLEVAKLKLDFPIFQRTMRNGSRLVYLDSGATSQKPNSVIDIQDDFYRKHNAAVHRGAHLLAEEADERYETAREITANFIGAKVDEIIFTKSATESLNLLAYSISNANAGSRFHLQPGDEILVSEMEHHANLIPWQELSKRTGAKLKWIPVNSEGRLDLSEIRNAINSRTKIVSITHQSNVLGTINPIAEISKLAKAVNALMIVDACQSVPHLPVNVSELGVDFLAFSAHKALGPTGVGVLWGKAELLAELPPFLFGGSMIESVTMESATYAPAPRKFEAGVPNMAGVIGLGEALTYLKNISMESVAAHEAELTAVALERLSEIEHLTIFGPKEARDRGSIFSFAIDEVHPHDAGQVLDQYGIAVRTGHHCAWPLMKKFGLTGTIRASFYLYNDLADLAALVEGIEEVKRYFKVGK
jgi:cysteine desulfurase/selenocysteine lyase